MTIFGQMAEGPLALRWWGFVAKNATDTHHLAGAVPSMHAVRRAPARRGCISRIDRPTSIDVARCAGVSQSTVSLVFSGKGRGRVSEATAQRVRDCARELGYRPNVAAQALRLGASRAVALLVPDMTNPFFSRVLRGAQRAAASAGYIVILVDTQNDRHWESQSFEALRAGPVDGYLLFEVTAPEALGPDENVVLMETEERRRPSVRFDGEAGATAAFQHLVELGHRRIGHLAAAFRALTFEDREKARRHVLTEAGLDPDAQPRVLTPISIEDARVNAGPLLDQEPTAVFCDDDVIAAGMYLAARERGVSIPGDLSVVGFDDMDFARVLEPPLTTVALDAELLGSASFELLEARMAGRRTRKRVVLPAELLVRGSTAPPD
jgi:DNA-binding LacI/PurR family transcriptional regulator